MLGNDFQSYNEQLFAVSNGVFSPVKHNQKHYQNFISALTNAGVKNGDIVVVVISYYEYFFSLLESAIAELGAIIFPIASSGVRWHIPMVLSNLNISVVITDSHVCAKYFKKTVRQCPIIILGKDGLQPMNEMVVIKSREKLPEISALLLTSGSTSISKIIALSAQNMLVAYNEFSALDFMKTNDTYLNILPLTFSGGRKVHYASLKAGHKIYFADRNISLEQNLLLSEANITAGTPWHLKKIIDSKVVLKNPLIFVCGGAPLSEQARLEAEQMGINVLPVYGLTETSSILSYSSLNNNRTGSVGKLSNSVEVLIHSDGQISVKGKVVSPGKIVNHSLVSLMDEQGWLCTGDRGYFDKDGFLFLSGRIDKVIKLNSGVSINLSELENSMASLLTDCAYKIWIMKEEFIAISIFHGMSESTEVLAEIKNTIKKFNAGQAYPIQKLSIFNKELLPGDQVKKNIPLDFIQSLNGVYLTI